MKILYVYKDYMGRRKDYGKMIEICGHQVIYLEKREKERKNILTEKEIKKYKPDLVWFQNPYYIYNNLETIEYIKSKNIITVIYNTYLPKSPYVNDIDIWKNIDFLFIHNKEFNEFLINCGLNSYYMPLGFYPSQYYKIINKKKYNVSFCGTALERDDIDKDKRAKYIRALKKYNICVFGKSFKGKVDKIPVYFYKTHDQQREIYSKTIINLDLPFFHSVPSFYSKKYHIKNRFFEIPATGNFLLTVRFPEFLDIFDEDTVGYYDDSIESLKESVKRYLKDDKLRKKMARKAYRLVRQKHTYLHRFKEMFKIIEG